MGEAMISQFGRMTGHAAGSGYRGGGRSPIGIGGAIALHGAALAVFLLMPKEMIDEIRDWKPLILVPVLPETTPPETQPEQKDSTRPVADPVTRTDPFVKTPIGEAGTIDGPLTPPDGGTGGTGIGIVIPPPPIPLPLFVDAQIDPRALSAFQPDYPGAMIRQSQEGTVTVQVQIDADGRVTDIEKISATDDAFWLATQRHALRKWRFKPATRDGVPVPSSKQLTVHFRLEDK